MPDFYSKIKIVFSQKIGPPDLKDAVADRMVPKTFRSAFFSHYNFYINYKMFHSRLEYKRLFMMHIEFI